MRYLGESGVVWCTLQMKIEAFSLNNRLLICLDARR